MSRPKTQTSWSDTRPHHSVSTSLGCCVRTPSTMLRSQAFSLIQPARMKSQSTTMPSCACLGLPSIASLRTNASPLYSRGAPCFFLELSMSTLGCHRRTKSMPKSHIISSRRTRPADARVQGAFWDAQGRAVESGTVCRSGFVNHIRPEVH